jgi:hypothetical protein
MKMTTKRRRITMITVKSLIKELLEMPMDATVLIAVKNAETAEYKYYGGGVSATVDYEDGTCGILVKGKEAS